MVDTKLILLFLSIFSSALFSCDRVKNKGQSLARHAEKKINDQKNAAIDQLLPTFDSYHPDTKFNKKRFREFFGFDPTPDVKDIYCFDDQMGIDAQFLFSFTCDTSTRNRIITFLELKPCKGPDNFSEGLWVNYPWWDSAAITRLTPYSFKGPHQSYRYLWSDTSKRKIYYIDFDM